jgi:hypothetical protein
MPGGDLGGPPNGGFPPELLPFVSSNGESVSSPARTVVREACYERRANSRRHKR